jgi:hypothetical protein
VLVYRDVLYDWMKTLTSEQEGKGEYMAEKPKNDEESWTKLKAEVVNAISNVLLEYDNMGRNIAQEQQSMMERMKQVYLQARKVTRAMERDDVE